MEDVKWLGFDWEDRLYYASDYFEELYQYAIKLIELRKAYVCDLSPEEVREYRGTLTEPGKESPYRNRSVEENLDLFQRMKNGEFRTVPELFGQELIWLPQTLICVIQSFTVSKGVYIIEPVTLGVFTLCMTLPIRYLTLLRE